MTASSRNSDQFRQEIINQLPVDVVVDEFRLLYRPSKSKRLRQRRKVEEEYLDPTLQNLANVMRDFYQTLLAEDSYRRLLSQSRSGTLVQRRLPVKIVDLISPDSFHVRPLFPRNYDDICNWLEPTMSEFYFNVENLEEFRVPNSRIVENLYCPSTWNSIQFVE